MATAETARPLLALASTLSGYATQSPVPLAEPLIKGDILQQILPRKLGFVRAVHKDNFLDKLRKKYRPINVTTPTNEDKHVTETTPATNRSSASTPHKTHKTEEADDPYPEPRVALFPKDRILQLMLWPAPRKVGATLHNYGNTCFVNAVLQALTYLPPLANYMLTREHTRKCRNPGFCVFCALERHIVKALNSSGTVISPREIVSNLRIISRTFRFNRQEDAHEFLRYVIDKLQLNFLASYPQEKDRRVQETSLVHRIFGGTLQSQVRCANTSCRHASNTFEAFLDLSLEISGHSCATLEGALKHFFRAEVLDRHNMYRCERCRIRTQATKQFSVLRPPAVLAIHLKRFRYGGLAGKIARHVAFEAVLSLGPYMATARSAKKGSQPASDRYTLAAVVVHAGSSVHSGHYYAFVRSPAGVWYEMNDTECRQVAMATVLSQQAYLLFYVRDVPSDVLASPLATSAPVPRPLPTPADSVVSARKSAAATARGVVAAAIPPQADPSDESEESDEDEDERVAKGSAPVAMETTPTKPAGATNGVSATKSSPRGTTAVVRGINPAQLSADGNATATGVVGQFGSTVGIWEDSEEAKVGAVQQNMLLATTPALASANGFSPLGPSLRKRKRDEWDEEYDAGRKKKVRRKEDWAADPTALEVSNNPFQKVQNRKLSQCAARALSILGTKRNGPNSRFAKAKKSWAKHRRRRVAQKQLDMPALD